MILLIIFRPFTPTSFLLHHITSLNVFSSTSYTFCTKRIQPPGHDIENSVFWVDSWNVQVEVACEVEQASEWVSEWERKIKNHPGRWILKARTELPSNGDEMLLESRKVSLLCIADCRPKSSHKRSESTPTPTLTMMHGRLKSEEHKFFMKNFYNFTKLSLVDFSGKQSKKKKSSFGDVPVAHPSSHVQMKLAWKALKNSSYVLARVIPSFACFAVKVEAKVFIVFANFPLLFNASLFVSRWSWKRSSTTLKNRWSVAPRRTYTHTRPATVSL